ncbi:MAG TPA: hypothetical protein VGM94_04980 [Galbitalea sp.]|jgi:hypothetical protein
MRSRDERIADHVRREDARKALFAERMNNLRARSATSAEIRKEARENHLEAKRAKRLAKEARKNEAARKTSLNGGGVMH